MSDVFSNQHVRDLMEEFDNALSKSQLQAVDILHENGRAPASHDQSLQYRNWNWDLHLESFAAMLPWLTIYDHTNYARWGPVYLAGRENLEAKAPKVRAEFIAGNFVVKRTNKRFN